MIRFSSLCYLIKEGVRNIWNNRIMSLASIGVLVACMLLIGGALLLSLNITSIVGFVEDQSEAVIFLDDNLSDNEHLEIENKIRASRNINKLQFVSKEEGLAEMMESLGDDGILFEAYSEDNNLPDSFRVTIDDVSRLSETVAQIESIEGVYSVSAPTELAHTITSIKNIVYICGSVVVGILIVVSIMIIGNTIKLTVFSRRREISIMKYVGATDGFIRFPFIIEGFVLGLISALFSYLLLWYGYNYLLEWLRANPGSLASVLGSLVPFAQIARKMLLGFLVGGVGIGVIGSSLFINKHMNV